LRNKHGEQRQFMLSLSGDPTLRLQIEGTPYATVPVPPNAAHLQRVYVISPKGSAPSTQDATPFRIWVEDNANGERAHKDTTFNGKEN